MLRTIVCTVLALAICTVGLIAAEIKGKVKKIEKGVITVTVGDKDVDVWTSKETKWFDGDKEVTEKKDKGTGFPQGKKKRDVVITTEKKDDKEFATKIVVK